MKNKILISVLFLFTTVSSFLAWFFIDQLVNSYESSGWLAPAICFSIIIVSYHLSMVLINDVKMVSVMMFFSLFLSFVFVLDFFHITSISIGFLFLMWSFISIRKELEAGVRINSWRIFSAGKLLIVFALSLVIASQYFFEIKKLDVARQIPKFQTQKISNLMVPKILAITNSEFKNMESESITVDQFIVNTQKNENIDLPKTTITDEDIEKIINEQFGENISPTQRLIYKAEIEKNINSIYQSSATSQALILVQGRSQLSNMLGEPLTGNEKIADVLANKIDSSIAIFIAPLAARGEEFPILPISMAIILFLSVFSLGSFLILISIFIASLIFKLLIRMKIISIGKTTKEVDILE